MSEDSYLTYCKDCQREFMSKEEQEKYCEQCNKEFTDRLIRVMGLEEIKKPK